MTTTPFARYARYYDLLYREKDYAAEARLVDGLLRPDGAQPGALLDVGCGTGAHAREFSRFGWQVAGVDLSSEMIALAVARTPAGAGVTYSTGSAASFDLGRIFSAAVSLFHVASYHTGREDLFQMLANIRRHLSPGGRLVFDFWHGPGVLADPPARRERRIDDGTIEVVRISEPVHTARRCTVDVNYDVAIREVATGTTERISEVHRMRYFFLPELEFMLARAGFTITAVRGGITEAELDDRSWYGLVAARVT